MAFAFIDAHVHFWDRTRLPYPWLEALPSIAEPHWPETLRAESGDTRAEKIVFVECGAPWLDEVEWVGELARAEPRIAAIVAKVAVDLGPHTREALRRLREGHPLVRGIRHIIQDEADPAFCLRDEFIAGVRAVATAGYSFDLCCRHHQLGAVVELVRRCPEVAFILDHAGKPDLAGGRLDAWRRDIAALAALPNVVCKFSGLVTEADHATWTPALLQPVAEHLRATFGPARLLFGSDWPVVKLAASYAHWLDTARALVAAWPAADQAALFAGNAARVYRLV